MTTTNQLQIVYGPRAGQPGQRIPYTIKTHMDLLVDNFGIAKVFGLTVKNDQIEVMPRVPDPVTGAKDTIWVGTNIIRPLDAICTYERNRFMRQLECKRKLEELGLTSPPTDSAKKKREAPVRAETPATHRDARPATEAARMREGPPPGAPSFDDATDPAPGNEPEKGEEEAEAEAGAEHEAEDETEEEAEANKSHKSAQAWFTRCMQEMRGEFDEMRSEMKAASQSKRAGRPKTPAERRAATKAVRMARGFDWNDPALATDPVNVVQYKMQPWIAKGIESSEELMLELISPKSLQLSQEAVLNHVYSVIEGMPPTSADLTALIEQQKFRSTREAANRIWRDLKFRFFKKIFTAFRAATIEDALKIGVLHGVDSLYVAFPGQGVTLMTEFGHNNQRKSPSFNEPYMCPSQRQYMIATAELTESKNLSTGLVTFKPYVGGSILDAVIAALTKDGELPKLDFLSVVQGYCMAKEFNINVNQGFNLKLAAEEWKAWCAARSHAMPRHATPRHATPHRTTPHRAAPHFIIPCLVSHIQSLTHTGFSTQTRARKAQSSASSKATSPPRKLAALSALHASLVLGLLVDGRTSKADAREACLSAPRQTSTTPHHTTLDRIAPHHTTLHSSRCACAGLDLLP